MCWGVRPGLAQKKMSTWYIIIKVVYIFATALSFIFSLFFVFEVQKSKVPYDLFKYPLNRHTYNFHRVVKVLLFLWKITFKGSLNMSSQWIGWVAIYTKQRAISQYSTAMPHSFHWTVEVASSLLGATSDWNLSACALLCPLYKILRILSLDLQIGQTVPFTNPKQFLSPPPLSCTAWADSQQRLIKAM